MVIWGFNDFFKLLFLHGAVVVFNYFNKQEVEAQV